MLPDRLANKLRGRAFVIRQHVEGGERTELHGRVRISRPAPGTTLRFGRYVWLYQDVGIYLDAAGATLSIGNRTYINRRTEITCEQSVSIGDNCAISWDVLITDTDYHQLGGGDPAAPVVIGDHVWIGARAMVLKGVTIGDGAVVAAGSIVTRDVEPGALVAGNPARQLRDDVTWK
ncbi:MAG: acyltransferase [Mycobacteriales bacterium]